MVSLLDFGLRFLGLSFGRDYLNWGKVLYFYSVIYYFGRYKSSGDKLFNGFISLVLCNVSLVGDSYY